MTSTIRMPMAVASRKGVSALAAQSIHDRVVLTSHGRPVAVVDSAERLDEDARKMREAARTVVDSFADLALQRGPAGLDLDALCAALGVDANLVRRRAVELPVSQGVGSSRQAVAG